VIGCRESFYGNHRVIICVIVNPFDRVANVNRQSERAKTVFIRNIHLFSDRIAKNKMAAQQQKQN
jgi:hypothetical protein